MNWLPILKGIGLACSVIGIGVNFGADYLQHKIDVENLKDEVLKAAGEAAEKVSKK